MFRKMDNMLWSAKRKMTAFVTGLKEDESGIDGLVAAIILVLIVVLLAVAFYTFLGDWFQSLWSQITGTASAIS